MTAARPVNPLRIDTPEAMMALGARIARLCPAQAVVYVEGALGVGKTTLVRGALRGLGYAGRVPSPTFSLVEPYSLGGRSEGRSVVHVDLYRVSDAGELEFLGLEDLLGPRTLLLVEWPERGGGRLPRADLHVRMAQLAGDAREVSLEPETPAAQALVDVLVPV